MINDVQVVQVNKESVLFCSVLNFEWCLYRDYVYFSLLYQFAADLLHESLLIYILTVTATKHFNLIELLFAIFSIQYACGKS